MLSEWKAERHLQDAVPLHEEIRFKAVPDLWI